MRRTDKLIDNHRLLDELTELAAELGRSSRETQRHRRDGLNKRGTPCAPSGSSFANARGKKLAALIDLCPVHRSL
jgi:hypothetical protein